MCTYLCLHTYLGMYIYTYTHRKYTNHNVKCLTSTAVKKKRKVNIPTKLKCTD